VAVGVDDEHGRLEKRERETGDGIMKTRKGLVHMGDFSRDWDGVKMGGAGDLESGRGIEGFEAFGLGRGNFLEMGVWCGNNRGVRASDGPCVFAGGALC
jgi:hypothetical protein